MKIAVTLLATLFISIALSYASERSVELHESIEAFVGENEVQIAAVLFQDPGSRRANSYVSTDKPDPSGFQSGSMKVPFLAASEVPGRIVDLYTSIEKLPRCAGNVKILYTHSSGGPESFLGYTIENPVGLYTKLVLYDGSLPWLEWIARSFKFDDAEQFGDEQPATAPELKPEGDEEPEPESEGRTQ